jgi:hypothetical protein
MTIGKVAAHLCLTLIVKELKQPPFWKLRTVTASKYMYSKVPKFIVDNLKRERK